MRRELDEEKAQRKLRRGVPRPKGCKIPACPDFAKPGSRYCLDHERLLG